MPNGVPEEFKALKKAYAKGIELRGKTLGIVGFGRIGTSVAQYALGCGMHVIGCDREGTSRHVDVKIQLGGGNVQEVTVEVPLMSLDEVLAQADAITFHVPAQADGSPVLDADGVAAMKSGAMLVNTARGGTVDEAAVSAAVASATCALPPSTSSSESRPPRKALLQVDRALPSRPTSAPPPSKRRTASERNSSSASSNCVNSDSPPAPSGAAPLAFNDHERTADSSAQ